jgi:hypothetical protein
MSETTFLDPKVIEASKNFVAVIAHTEVAHGDREVVAGKEKLKLCNEYYNIPCSVHQKGAEVMGKFFNGVFGTPTTVFCEPSGAELFKAPGGMAAGEFLKKMNEASAKVSGERIPLSLWQLGRQGARDAEAALAKKDYRKAVETWTKLGKLKGVAFKNLSEDGLKKTEEEGQELLKQAQATENAEEKKKLLRKIADEFKPLAVAKEAQKLLEGK